MAGLKNRLGPVRTCLGCRTRKNQAQLLRLALVKGPGGARVVWDERRVRGGRGAWLCPDEPGCLKKALKVLVRAFRFTGEVDASALTSGQRKEALGVHAMKVLAR